MSKITLPSKKQALVIKIKSLEELTMANLAKLNTESTERYICIYFDGEVKAFVMAIKQEIHRKEVIAELREDLEFQISVLKQL